MTDPDLNKKARILDHGGETFDRYSAVYLKRKHARTDTYDMRGMSANPSHSQGFGQYSECSVEWAMGCDDKVIAFTDLPDACQRLVLSDLGLTA